jgi:NAD-dependent SIR2 family protein deacetylase
MPQKTVYFLGAGCSKNFGYPTTGEIMPLIFEKLRQKDLFQLSPDRKTRLEKKYERDLLQYMFMFYPGLKGLRHKTEANKNQIPGITEVLSLVDHFCFYNTPPHPSMVEAKMLQFRYLLNRAIVELLLEYERSAMSKEEEKLFYQFIRPISHKNKDEEISIITTNYDLLIDWEFSDLAAKNQIDYGISYRDVSTNEIIYRNRQPRFAYYKLHGSLNWLRCDLCGQYYINPDGNISTLAFLDYSDDYNTCICSHTLRLKSVLVAPSIVRDIRDANLLQIWKASTEAIRTADRIVFVGYSLPSEDLAIRSVIMRGLNGRSKRKPLKIEVAQCGDQAKFNYINLFGKNITYYPSGLRQFLGLTHSPNCEPANPPNSPQTS